jgi:hypothetical protein
LSGYCAAIWRRSFSLRERFSNATFCFGELFKVIPRLADTLFIGQVNEATGKKNGGRGGSRNCEG